MVTTLPPRLLIARGHLQQNRPEAAEAELRSILQEEPDSVPAQTLLAVLYFRTGRLAEAERLLAGALEKAPGQIDLIGLLAAIRKTQNDFTGAIPLFQSLVGLGHGNVDVYNQLGACWLELSDAVAAGNAFKRAIELDRTVAHSYYNLGMALKLAGKSFETFSTFKRAVELNPDFLDGYVQVWQQTRELLNWKEGLPILEQGLRRHRNSSQMRVMLAATYGKVGRRDKAEAMYRAAVEIDPAAGPPYAHWLQEEGRFEESIPVLKEAIRLNPVQGLAYYNLATAKCFEVDGKSLIDLASPLVEEGALGGEERMFLYYALAKSYDQAKDYRLAMLNYDLANEQAYGLFNAQSEHDPLAVDAEYATLVDFYTKEKIRDLSARGSKSSLPIFIVGMIRTGTTLLDQILSSHPQVESAGEQPFWQVSAGRVNRRWVETGGDAATMKELERDYLEVLREASGGAAKVTDKMPTNFTHIGLMSAVFPKAKFIHIRRSPLDTCLSIYTTFLGKGTQFAYRQENIVSYYRDYLRLMEHWRSVIPDDRMIEIDYEDLVSDKEAVLRKVLAFCGLEWDDACLNHEQNTSQVSTPSLWTARQPVNAASVERWRRYEPWLGKLLELKDATHPRRDA
ncbi:sulfotransferase [soil metagenome]